MGSESECVSLATYAKHRNVSRPAVSKAIKVGRLNRSVLLVNGVPKIRSIETADEEWSQGRTKAGPPKQLYTVEELAKMGALLSVFVAAGYVVLAWGPDREWICLPMAPEAARKLGAHISATAARAERGEDDCR